MVERLHVRFAFAGFVFDPDTGELLQNGLRVRINRQIADLLTLLIQHAGQLVTRDEIRDALWPGRELLNHEKVITNGISRLRFLLNDDPAQPRYIESIPKRGYRLVVEVRELEKPASALLAHSPEPVPQPSQQPSAPAESGVALVTTSHGEAMPAITAPVFPRRASFWQAPVWRWVALAVVAAGLLIAFFFYVSYAARHRPSVDARVTSLGIAPFEASGDGAEALASSFRLDLTDSLAQLPQVQVRAAHSLEMLKLNQSMVREEAPRLGLDVILFGRVTADGNQYHLQFELVSGKDGSHMASFQYSGTKDELAAIRDKVQMQTFSRLQLASQPRRASLGGTSDPEAYDTYLRARYHFSQQTADSLRMSLEEFKAAAARDPNFAKAYAGEANSYIFLWQHNIISRDEGFQGATVAARKALALDSSSAQAHAALGVVEFLHGWNLQEGENDLEQAVHIEPEQPLYHQLLALVLCDEGRFKESFHELDEAHTEDPLWVSAYVTEAHVASEAMDHNRMIASERKLKELMPESPHVRDAIANVDWADGRYLDAIAQWRAMAVIEGDAGRVQMEDQGLQALRRGGPRAYALVRLQAIHNRTGTDRHPNDFELPEWYAVAGEDAKALAAIHLAIEQRDPDVMQLAVLPPFQHLHHDPEFLACLHQVGLSLPGQENGPPVAPAPPANRKLSLFSSIR